MDAYCASRQRHRRHDRMARRVLTARIDRSPRRRDGYGAWLGMPGKTNNPFILVLAQFFEDKDPFAGTPRATLAPFAHFGIELPTKQDVDEMAERGKQGGCLAMPPTMMPQPIGYITMLRDPDGNMVEFSWDQGVFSRLHELWGQAD